MAEHYQDGSISPMSHTPQAGTPVQTEPSRFHPPDDGEINVQSRKPDVIAKDYWNEGNAHEKVSPLKDSQPELRDASKSQPAGSHDEGQLDGETTPPTGAQDSPIVAGGRSVQFATPDGLLASPAPTSHSRHSSWEGTESAGKHKANSLMSKIKALAISPNPNSNPNTPTAKPTNGTSAATLSPENGSAVSSPAVGRFGTRLPDTLTEEQSDADADIEETADEAAINEDGTAKKRKRRMRRFKKGHNATPSTSSRLASEIDTLGTYNRLLRRRASMPDTTKPSESTDQVLTDGDTRDNRRRPFRRGHSYVGAVATTPQGEDVDDMESSAVVGRRTGHLRRITVFGGGGVSDGDAMTPRRPFFNSERASNYGFQKWKQVKSTLRLLRQKKEDRFDYLKSAELMAELRAGAPAVLMLASMIQRDEHGNKRIPVLLEQLKLTIRDSSPIPDDDKDRHWIFTMDLEYGSGPSRMTWTVIRTIRDIYNLHFRYRFALNNDKYMLGRELGARPKQPKFPYSAFPYLRRARGKGGEESDEDDQASIRGDETGEGTQGEDHGHGIMSGGEAHRQPTRKKSRANLWGMRRRSTGFTDPGEMSNTEGPIDMATRRQRYIEKQRRTLEKYLSEMIRWLMFRADSNRICRFLELSALGVRLAAEGSYHGKEGYLHIQSSKGLDFRRVLTPAKVIARHSRKWFLVRQSYIACVDSPENMNIYDVYLIDSKFSIVSKHNALKQIGAKDKRREIDLTVDQPHQKHHTLTLNTSERKVRLFSRYQSVMKQFEDSINEMLRQTVWYEKKRFDSFAPVRSGVFAQWLVDGRDYMWNVSRAINMAKDVIYIHDWWLSPELYMRRPAAISQKWRLDRLLQKKAREGVKIFVIIYRNVEAAMPIDSEHTKFSLLNLHPNIFVQRSPNQFKKNQFFFAHHEKLCIVDHDVAFLGGVDLCFGRWDCPQHPITDDKPTGFEMTEQPKDAEHCQLFPGKDYSNPRVQDFFRLNEPYEEMYDRGKVPRMPWHDVGMQVVGQPARDLTRHFVQRWNYLRRGRKSTRPLPFLLPPPDSNFEELESLGLTGTCEVQMLRSASAWSLGIEETEHSIQNAYVKLIEESEHFIYMENQFFISSTEAYNTKIVNKIGDALVERIIRAFENGEDWRCVIMIPLMPGFQNTVDEQEGTSVRLIVMCQFASICRGEMSIFGRLRAAGIDPEDYIGFYSLRQWGVMSNDALVTEQLYIHAKAIIVDDRVALIGSANINERSMLGTRDSECAALVRDTDMMPSTMNGKPYEVGRFAHTLRVRLMREHLGLPVDEIQEEEQQMEMDRQSFEQEMEDIYQEDKAGRRNASNSGRGNSAKRHSHQYSNIEVSAEPSYQSGSDSSSSKDKDPETGMSKKETEKQRLDVSGYGKDHWQAAKQAGLDEGRDSVTVRGKEVLVHDIDAPGLGTVDSPGPRHQHAPARDNPYLERNRSGNADLPPAMPVLVRQTTEQLGLVRSSHLPPLPVVDDTDIGGPPVYVDPKSGRPKSGAFHPMGADIRPAHIDKDCMRDPLAPFIDEIWNHVAQNNTKLYRRVFRCMPDSEVTTWAEYREYVEYSAKFKASMDGKGAAEDNELQRETSNQNETAPTGTSVGIPAPDANAQPGMQSPVEEALRRLSEKLPVLEERSNMLDLSAQQEAQDQVDEKAELKTRGSADTVPRAPATLDTSLKTGDEKVADAPSPVYSNGDTSFPALENSSSRPLEPQVTRNTDRKTIFSTLEKPSSRDAASMPSAAANGSVKRRRRATTKGSRRGFPVDDMPSRADAEELLRMIQGTIVQFPYDWLVTEEQNGNWGYQVDGVAPLSI